MISVDNIFLKYPATRTDVIRGVTFNVKQGEIFGFLGPSGAGKSTLQRILTGVLRNYRGTARVIDIEIKNRTSAYYEKIGVDFEFPNFYGKFTAIENLNYFSSLYANPAIDPMLLMKRVGLQHEADKKVSGFSKGMKMRLAFIRSLIHNPMILFLDEPTSGLDPANARVIKDMILEQKQLGKTIILTTHNMHDAEELCDRVAFIVDGKISALDTPHSLRQSGANTKVTYSYIEDGYELEKSCLLAELDRQTDFQKSLKTGRITRIHSKEQTLEDVFIALTGRCLQ